MLPKLMAICAGAFFSYSFIAPDPQWFLAAVMAVFCICVLKGGFCG